MKQIFIHLCIDVAWSIIFTILLYRNAHWVVAEAFAVLAMNFAVQGALQRSRFLILKAAVDDLVLSSGVVMCPVDVSFSMAAKLSHDEICRVFRVPPHVLGRRKGGIR